MLELWYAHYMKRIILIDGMSGAGKTAVTKLLLEKLPRTAHIGMDVVKKFISDYERGVRDNDIAREVTFAMAEKYLDLDIGVIIEQPFRTEEMIRVYEELAKKHNIACYKFQIHANPEVALGRVLKRTEENSGDLTPERAKQNIAFYEPRGHQGFTLIDTTLMKPEEAYLIILEKIQSN